MDNFFTWDPEAIRAVIGAYGPLAPLAYMVFYSLAIAVMAPGLPLMFIGLVLFGPILGTLYTLISGTIGATLSFLAARHFGRERLRKRLYKTLEGLGAYEKKMARNGFTVVFMLRLFPVFPPGALNFALGLTSVSLQDYILGTALGVLPSTLFFGYFGSSLVSLDTARIVIAGILLSLVSLAFIPLKKRFHPERKR